MSGNTMDEGTARSKRCPFYLVRQYPSSSVAGTANSITLNTEPQPLNDGMCIASSCMMWKWAAGSSSEGYCGLAGKVVIP